MVFDLKDWFPDSAAAYYKNRMLKWILREGVWKVTKSNLDRSDRITTVSPSLVERLKKYGYNAKLITNGVDTDIFKPMDSREGKRMLGLDEDCFVIGYVGTLENWLDLDKVIIGLSELLQAKKDIYLAIIGGSLFTDYEKKLRAIIKEKKIENNVKFYGLIEYKNLPKYIAGMDICLIPFKITPVSDIALPNKLFEYSACGKPILSTPLPDVMKVGSENLFIYRDEEEFVDRVKYIMTNPREYEIDITAYSWKRKAGELESLLQGLIEGKK
ncbi:D-inositol-3-phosphate glycosyltransferase [ANME-1 cluster archaeon GoMg2]|nr:D-inositol-3-phosphate glycosyltransferase [ANME-1 cluster archaeon GoMg2]